MTRLWAQKKFYDDNGGSFNSISEIKSIKSYFEYHMQRHAPFKTTNWFNVPFSNGEFLEMAQNPFPFHYCSYRNCVLLPLLLVTEVVVLLGVGVGSQSIHIRLALEHDLDVWIAALLLIRFPQRLIPGKAQFTKKKILAPFLYVTSTQISKYSFSKQREINFSGIIVFGLV